jgi:hypothetical protein
MQAHLQQVRTVAAAWVGLIEGCRPSAASAHNSKGLPLAMRFSERQGWRTTKTTTYGQVGARGLLDGS